jgi:hypothetical protein
VAKVGPLDGPEPALQGPRRPIWRGTAGTLRSHDPGGLLSRFFFSSVTHRESHLSNASWLKTGASSHGYRQNSENFWPSLGPHIGAEHQEANFCGAQVLAGLNLVGLINLISGSLYTSAPLRGLSPSQGPQESSRKIRGNRFLDRSSGAPAPNLSLKHALGSQPAARKRITAIGRL